MLVPGRVREHERRLDRIRLFRGVLEWGRALRGVRPRIERRWRPGPPGRRGTARASSAIGDLSARRFRSRIPAALRARTGVRGPLDERARRPGSAKGGASYLLGAGGPATDTAALFRRARRVRPRPLPTRYRRPSRQGLSSCVAPGRGRRCHALRREPPGDLVCHARRCRSTVAGPPIGVRVLERRERRSTVRRRAPRP